MRLVILMPSLFYGGAETQFRRLFENIEDSYIATIDYAKGSQADEFRRKYDYRIKELRLYGSNNLWKSLQTYYNIICLLFLLRYKLKGRLMLVVYGSGTRWLLLYPIMRLLRYRILYSERNDGKHKLKLLYKIMSWCEVITTNSIEAKNELQRYITNKEIIVINNGVIIPPFFNSQYKILTPVKILVPARISRIKDQKVVIDALWDLNDVEIHFAGKVDEQDYYLMLQKKIKELNCADKFFFDGYIENMMEYYKDFSLVLLPSLSEGTANVLLECMALQIPCIASNIEMNKRLIRNDCFLFAVDNPHSLRDCVLNFISQRDTDIYEYLNENYTFVKLNYSTENMVKSFKSLVSSIC